MSKIQITGRCCDTCDVDVIYIHTVPAVAREMIRRAGWTGYRKNRSVHHACPKCSDKRARAALRAKKRK